MKKKKLLFGGLTLAASLMLVTPVFADDSATSESSITIGPGNGPTQPIDPEPKPEPPGTGNTGELTIDYVTPLRFEGKISEKDEVYITTAHNPNVQVTDRRGTGEGWSLQVSATPFVDENTNKTLKGAQLTLPQGSARTLPENISPAPKDLRKVVLSEETNILMQAQKDEGMGTWIDKFNPVEVTLSVPTGNYVGDYVSTLNWSLVAAPH